MKKMATFVKMDLLTKVNLPFTEKVKALTLKDFEGINGRSRNIFNLIFWRLQTKIPQKESERLIM
jgi:hypothetical protein